MVIAINKSRNKRGIMKMEILLYVTTNRNGRHYINYLSNNHAFQASLKCYIHVYCIFNFDSDYHPAPGLISIKGEQDPKYNESTPVGVCQFQPERIRSQFFRTGQEQEL